MRGNEIYKTWNHRAELRVRVKVGIKEMRSVCYEVIFAEVDLLNFVSPEIILPFRFYPDRFKPVR